MGKQVVLTLSEGRIKEIRISVRLREWSPTVTTLMNGPGTEMIGTAQADSLRLRTTTVGLAYRTEILELWQEQRFIHEVREAHVDAINFHHIRVDGKQASCEGWCLTTSLVSNGPRPISTDAQTVAYRDTVINIDRALVQAVAELTEAWIILSAIKTRTGVGPG
ncbi:hypothetical protein K488DRAFT_71663 [Vararia minispora EC-137]|uniref:Uncharacterized protein n=1 Tax=Vararia minispora EC-137 TaxID=1314806 RepID=A0ACB8QH35_9AGAM|nr:hypothetical protein K488DRAFT_71663 [Vararia minispora EC-137]